MVVVEATALQRYRSRATLDRSGARLVQDEATLVKMLEMAKSLSLSHQVLGNNTVCDVTIRVMM